MGGHRDDRQAAPRARSAARIAAVASKPLISGICTSIRTRSNVPRAAASTACASVVDDGDVVAALAEHRAGDALVDGVVLGEQDASAGVVPAPTRRAAGAAAARVAAAGIASSSGTVNEKTLPTSGVLSTRSVPPISRTSRRDRQAQPGAAVLARRGAVGLRERLEDQLLLARAAMPMPVSLTAKARSRAVPVVAPARRDRDASPRPRAVNLMALPTRLAAPGGAARHRPSARSGTSSATSQVERQALAVRLHRQRAAVASARVARRRTAGVRARACRLRSSRSRGRR